MSDRSELENIAAQAGEMVSVCEDEIADLESDLEDADVERIGKVEKALKEALDHARAAKAKVAGDAAAAKKFKAAKAKILLAEKSFNAAREELKKAGKESPANKKPSLKKAQKLIAKDLEHLKEALEAIE